jgi:hypothetical protein
MEFAPGPAHTHRIPSVRPHAASRIGPGALRCRASLPRHRGRPLGVGFSAVLPMSSPASSLRRRQQDSPALRCSALRGRDDLVLEHLPLADALASAAARRLFPLVEREDLIQVAREALVRFAPRCRAGEPPAPDRRRCITGGFEANSRVLAQARSMQTGERIAIKAATMRKAGLIDSTHKTRRACYS